MMPMPQIERVERRLRIVRVVAFVDLVLLIILVSAAITGQKEIVHVIGPLHGINFLLLLVIVGVAAIDGLWRWWFPVVVLLTAGPPGAFIGEWILHKRVREQKLLVHNTSTVDASTPLSTDISKNEQEGYV
jgi:hypothetical protein